MVGACNSIDKPRDQNDFSILYLEAVTRVFLNNLEAASGRDQGKIFRKIRFSENFPFPVLPGKYFPAQFRIFRFQNSKIQKNHKNENRIFRPDFVAFRSDFGAFRAEKIVLAM